MDHRFVWHILAIWSIRRLDELIIEMVFGCNKLAASEAQGSNLKKELKQNLKQFVTKLGKKNTNDSVFNQIGIYNESEHFLLSAPANHSMLYVVSRGLGLVISLI